MQTTRLHQLADGPTGHRATQMKGSRSTQLCYNEAVWQKGDHHKEIGRERQGLSQIEILDSFDVY